MNQSFINGLHFVIRLLLTAGLGFFLVNTAFDERFMSFWILLAVLALLFIASATIEFKFTPTTDFWLRLPVRLISMSLLWLVNVLLLITVSRSEILFILLLILSYNLFTLLLEWRRDYKNTQTA